MDRAGMPKPETADQERVNGFRFVYGCLSQACLVGATFDRVAVKPAAPGAVRVGLSRSSDSARATSSADPSFPGPSAYVVLANQSPIPPWVSGGPSSKWIAPRAATNSGNSLGNYDYRTTFSLTGMDPDTVALSGSVAADDHVTIYLNGTQMAAMNFEAYAGWSAFAISSGFVAGTNTLDFVVNNAGSSSNPTGLNVQISGTAQPAGSLGSGEYVTRYNYDRVFGHLIGVTMSRGTTTQGRYFTYSFTAGSPNYFPAQK